MARIVLPHWNEASRLPDLLRKQIQTAARGLCRLDSRFWTDDDLLAQDFITVEVWQEPTIHTVKVAKVKEWVRTHALNPIVEEKKQELRRILFGGTMK